MRKDCRETQIHYGLEKMKQKKGKILLLASHENKIIHQIVFALINTFLLSCIHNVNLTRLYTYEKTLCTHTVALLYTMGHAN